MPSIIICADDFAITPEVSEGIALLAEQGRISATSVMSLSPHWPSQAALLKNQTLAIDVGLHVDFTSDFAQQNGQGYALGELMFKSCLGALSPGKIELALHQQLDLFELHHGNRPQHVDGHQHVHQFPVIRDVLAKVLTHRYSASQMPWLRISKVPPNLMSIKASVINAMGAHAMQQLADQLHIPHSSFLTGIYDFSGNAQTYTQLLQRCLQDIPAGSVLMCHPGMAGNQSVPFPLARIWEQQVLQGSEFTEMLTSLQLELVRGSLSLPTHT